MAALLQNKAGMNPRLWNMCCPTYFAFPIVNQTQNGGGCKTLQIVSKGTNGT